MRTRLRHLRAGLVASAVLMVLGAVPGWLWGGAAGLAGLAAGLGLVAASYLLSSLVIAWADQVNFRLVLPVGLMTYVLKFTLIGILMAAVSGSGWSGLPAMGVGVIAGVIGWCTAQAWWTWHARIPYVEVS